MNNFRMQSGLRRMLRKEMLRSCAKLVPVVLLFLLVMSAKASPAAELQEYKWQIVGIISLCLLEGGLIVALLVQRSSRRRAEISALASKRLLQATIDALNVRVALLDQRGTIVAVNRPWKAFSEAN